MIRFRIRHLLIATAVVATLLAGVGRPMHEARRQRLLVVSLQAVADKDRAGWTPDLLDVTYAQRVTAVRPGRQVCDLERILELTGLEYLDLSQTQVRDLQGISKLTRLKTLSLRGSPSLQPRQLAHTQELSQLSELEELDLTYTDFSDLEPVSTLRCMKRLRLSSTAVQDVSALSGLGRLEELDVSNCNVSDVTVLGELDELQVLNLDHSCVADLAPLARLRHLRELSLRSTPIRDVSLLRDMQSLRVLIVHEVDLSALRGLKQLVVNFAPISEWSRTEHVPIGITRYGPPQ